MDFQNKEVAGAGSKCNQLYFICCVTEGFIQIYHLILRGAQAIFLCLPFIFNGTKAEAMNFIINLEKDKILNAE